MPGAYEGDNTFVLAVLLAFVLGLVVVYLMDRFAPPEEEEAFKEA
jgi:putative membrane protein